MPNRLPFGPALAGLVFFGQLPAQLAAQVGGQSADLIVTGGRIRTGTAWSEAMAVADLTYFSEERDYEQITA